jgi:hypothetical protein
MTLNHTGSLGINLGSNAPSYRLHVNGDIYSSGDIIAFSDCNVKTDIQRIENAIEKIKQISGYTYRRIDEPQPSRRYAGLLAQEVQQILPEVVHQDSNNKLSVAYGNVISLVVEAIKELSAEITEIKYNLTHK